MAERPKGYGMTAELQEKVCCVNKVLYHVLYSYYL